MNESGKIIRCAIYIRVSTAEQKIYGKSLEAQKECLIDYANNHNMKVAGIYADEGKTARKEFKKRKAIHALLEDVKAGNIEAILFWKMDRWFRNVSDFYKVQDILDAYNVTWTAVAEPNMNLETRDGRLNLNIMLSIGQNEVDTTSERIRFTVNSMINNGRIVWGDANLPLGYKIDEIDGGKKIVKNEEDAPVVEEVFRYFEKHQNKSATVKHIQSTFGIEFTYVMLRTMLSSEFYIGKYRTNDNYCPAYLSKSQWDKIQSISKRNIKHGRSNRIYLFSGLMRCPYCNQKLAGTGCTSIINRKTGEKKTYCYYRCNHAHIDHSCQYTHRVSQNLIENYLMDHLEELFSDFYINHVLITQKKKTNKKARTKEKIVREMERLNLMYQKERITWDYYNEQYEGLEKELNSFTPVTDPPKDYSHIKNLLKSDFKSMYSELAPLNRQAFWRGIIEQIILDENNNIKAVQFF